MAAEAEGSNPFIHPMNCQKVRVNARAFLFSCEPAGNLRQYNTHNSRIGEDMDWNSFINSRVHPMVAYKPGMRGSEVRALVGCEAIHKLSSNENPYGPFPRAQQAGKLVIEHLNRYPDGSARDLRSRLSERFSVPTSQILMGNGSNEILIHIAETCLAPGDEVIYGWPSFVVYPIMCQLTDAVAVPVPLDENDAYNLAAIADAITPATKMIVLCNPNNPTGTIFTKDAFEAFLDKVPDHVLVVIDEAYFEYSTAANHVDGLNYFDGQRPIAVLRTFSKIYSLAGARCGYGIMPAPLVEAIDKIREPFNVNTLAQCMAYYSLDDPSELNRRIAQNAEQRTLLCACLDELGIGYAKSETNFVYAYTDKPQILFQELLKRGVIVRDFGNAPALRIGVGSPEDTQSTIDALRQIHAGGVLR